MIKFGTNANKMMICIIEYKNFEGVFIVTNMRMIKNKALVSIYLNGSNTYEKPLYPYKGTINDRYTNSRKRNEKISITKFSNLYLFTINFIIQIIEHLEKGSGSVYQ
jgi:hypothetical protein